MKQQTKSGQAHGEIERVFRVLLPANGLAVREEQVRLCHEMLDAVIGGKIALCDAGVGIGKTYAYLVACVILHRFWPSQARSTVTVSTASVALQDAILKEYVPFLSRVLLQDGLIAAPLQAVVRKGKERFVCDSRLADRLSAVQSKKKNAQQRSALLLLRDNLELDAVPGLSGFDRRLVCVPPICPKDCSDKQHCRFNQYILRAKSDNVFIQICNHNYLLADAHHRQAGITPLLRDARVLIVDEAHKLPEAAQQMYGRSASLEHLLRLADWLEKESFTWTGQQVRENSLALFASLAPAPGASAQSAGYTAAPESRAALRSTMHSLRTATRNLRGKAPRGLLNRLEENADTLALFERESKLFVRYIEYENGAASSLCAASRSLPQLLEQALWNANVPTVLTSGTLAAGNSFERTKQRTGLANSKRVQETKALSPFDYKQNCLLCLPVNASKDVAEAIKSLIQATHGHTLVLFTSYGLMAAVNQKLKGCLEYPLYMAWRNGTQTAVQAFKRQPNAVLFAAGSCWEGVDFPGDMVSSLILARLPFPVPNPISEDAKLKYATLQDYIHTEIIPDMQIKLRQGFGRAIRTETDTCAVSILDPRAAPGGRYHKAVIDALPEMFTTQSIADVGIFMRNRKGPDYFS